MKVDSLQATLSVQPRYETLKNSINSQELNRDDLISVNKSAAPEIVDVFKVDSSSGNNYLGLEESRGLVEQANALLKVNDSDIEFKLDDESGKAIFYIKDAASGEILRQIPNESMLRLSKNIEQFLDVASQLSGSKNRSTVLSGLLTDEKA